MDEAGAVSCSSADALAGVAETAGLPLDDLFSQLHQHPLGAVIAGAAQLEAAAIN
jgi:hypothetical protein